MERIGFYTVEITDADGYKRFFGGKNFVTTECKSVYMWEETPLAIAIPKTPPFPDPLVLEDPFVSNNASLSGNLVANKTVSKIEDKETIDGRIRRYKTTAEFVGPMVVLGFIFHTNYSPLSAVNMPFVLNENEKMHVYYSMLMRW